MTYRPTLSDKTKDEIDELKETLKELEEKDFKGREKSTIMWRRNNGTFDLDFLIRKAIKEYGKDL